MSDDQDDQTTTDDSTTLSPADVASELLDDWRYLMGAARPV